MKHTIFTGMATAMVTPMNGDGVDYEALGNFIEFQIANGINALVAVGTTGESATLSPAERKEVIRFYRREGCRQSSCHCRYRHQQHRPRYQLQRGCLP